MNHRARTTTGIVLGLALGVSASGCGSHAEPASATGARATTGATATGSVQNVGAPANAAAPAAPAAPPFPDIGVTGPIGEHTAAAFRANGDALALHRRRNYEGSLAGFEAAIAASPTYLMAHFNRACALSRLGRFADVTPELERILRADLVQFGRLVDEDPDLEAFRASPEAARVVTLRTELAAAYARAAEHGIPAIAFEPTTVEAGASRATLRHKQRFGFFVAEASRFVPITPAHENAFGVVYSADHGTVTLLHGPWATEYYQVFPRNFDVDVVRLSAPATPIASARLVEGAFGRLYTQEHEDIASDDEMAWSMTFASVGVRPFADGVAIEARALGEDGRDTRMRVDVTATGIARGAHTHDAEPLSSVRMVEGVVVDSALPQGYSITGHALTVPGSTTPFALPNGQSQRQVVAAADASAAYVMTVASGCANRGEVSHRLARIDLRSFEMRTLDEGRGGGMIVRAPDGRLFVQLGENERAIGADGALSDAGLPAHLSLAVPVADSDCTM